MSEESKGRMSEARKGKKRSPGSAWHMQLDVFSGGAPEWPATPTLSGLC